MVSSVEKNYLNDQILESDLVSAPVKIKMMQKDFKNGNLKGSASPPMVVRISLAQPVLRKKSSSSKMTPAITKPIIPLASPKKSQVPV
jgi:hypothetical protein